MNEHICRVCGLYSEDPPWGEDGTCPNYEYCLCCGVEFGNEDYTIQSVKNYRREWLNNGSEWFFPKERPIEWNIEEQFKNISQEFI